MDPFPPPHDKLPFGLRQTIWNTYKGKTAQNANFAWELGFVGNDIKLSLAELLDRMDKAGRLQVISEAYDRCTLLPGLWDAIVAITGIWTYPAGHGVSQGFNCSLKDADVLVGLLRGPAAEKKFCEDEVSVHGPRDCFRELVKSGAGLHICVAQTGSRSTHEHDYHIDKYQVICDRKSDGKCNYHYFNTNFYDHMKDVIPWWIGKTAKEIAANPPQPALKPGEPKL